MLFLDSVLTRVGASFDVSNFSLLPVGAKAVPPGKAFLPAAPAATVAAIVFAPDEPVAAAVDDPVFVRAGVFTGSAGFGLTGATTAVVLLGLLVLLYPPYLPFFASFAFSSAASFSRLTLASLILILLMRQIN